MQKPPGIASKPQAVEAVEIESDGRWLGTDKWHMELSKLMNDVQYLKNSIINSNITHSWIRSPYPCFFSCFFWCSLSIKSNPIEHSSGGKSKFWPHLPMKDLLQLLICVVEEGAVLQPSWFAQPGRWGEICKLWRNKIFWCWKCVVCLLFGT